MPRRGKLGNNPGNDVHLTPPEIWERLSTIGPIYDPCPHPWTVCGLTTPWAVQPGDVAYCNPPFSALLDWSIKMCAEADRGATVVGLVPVRTSQPYWDWLCRASGKVAFWTGDKHKGGDLSRRVRFLTADGVRQPGAPFDTALFLMTSNVEHSYRFRIAFDDVATVVGLI